MTMQKKSIAALLLCLMMSVTALADTGIILTDDLNIREGASSDTAIIGSLDEGDRVAVLKKSGWWYKIDTGKVVGYVYREYIRIVEDEGLAQGDDGPEVKKMQQRLKELGYFDYNCTGTYAALTAQAVKDFQKRNGLSVTGQASEKTLDKLYSSSAKKANGSTAGTSSSSSSSSDKITADSLQKGQTSNEVKKLQSRLAELGYFDHKVTGYYGDVTVKAVKAFQQRNGLTVNGRAGAATLKKLNSSSAKKADSGSTSGSSSSTTVTVIRKGMSGDEVRKIQQRLKDLGYFDNKVTGYYGDITVAAVKAFQKRNDLSQTGSVESVTLKKLNSSSAKKAEGYKEDSSTDVDSIVYGKNNAAIKAMQQRLKDLGYFKTTCTGYFGSTTQKSVKAFQSRNGLSATGVVNSATLNKINSSSAKPAEGYEAAKTLSKGDQGADVKKMQQRLKDLGYFKTTCTGYFGGVTEAALKAFQKNNGLTADGKLGSATSTKLYSSSAKKASSSGSSSSSSSSTATLKRGSTGTQVRSLQNRLKDLGYFSDYCNGTFGEKTEAAVKLFQKQNGMSQTGTVTSNTMKKILSSSAKAYKPEYKTEKLDWFRSDNADTIPNRATFQVKDVRTGLVFTAKRQGGKNHLDAEPLTAADAAILLKINGGIYKWQRRPMLVKYGNHVYAASIYSEPHGSDTIGNNNFDGQFCLHFYNSKTHGTNKVDSDHQACVAQAMKATW